MMNDEKWTALQQAEDMAYFKADLCCYSPESYSLDEKKAICNDMISTSKAVLDAMHPKGTLSGLRPSGARRLRTAARRC
jgi:hypothetical protein